MKTGIELIAQERAKQIERHGYTPEHDLTENQHEELGMAAFKILSLDFGDAETTYPYGWPAGWNEESFHRIKAKSYRNRMIVIGALIAAELDRIG